MSTAAATPARAEARSRALAAAWRESRAYRHVAAGLDAGAPEDPEGMAAAERLLADPWWAAALIAPLHRAIGDDPWVQPPLRVARDAKRVGARLYDGVAASLTVAVVDAGATAAATRPATLVCSGRMTVVRYHRAAGWRLDRWRLDGAGVLAPVDAQPLRDGDVVRLDGRAGAFELVPDRAEVRDAVTLTVTSRAATNAREHDRAGGALRRLAAASEADSRTQMLLTLLRVSERRDAAAAFEQATRAEAFALRWAAMREWLALDVAVAAPRLAMMATDDPHPEVRDAACATLPLVEAHLCRA